MFSSWEFGLSSYQEISRSSHLDRPLQDLVNAYIQRVKNFFSSVLSLESPPFKYHIGLVSQKKKEKKENIGLFEV